MGGSLLTYLAPNPGCLPAGTNVCVAGGTTERIPLLLSIPKTGSAPWPVVIYQHGITTNRATMLAVAGATTTASAAWAQSMCLIDASPPCWNRVVHTGRPDNAFALVKVEQEFVRRRILCIDVPKRAVVI